MTRNFGDVVFTAKQIHVLDYQIDAAAAAVEAAMDRLTKLQAVLSATDDLAKLAALTDLARHAGYSNSATTAVAELMTAAGAVHGITSCI